MIFQLLFLNISKLNLMEKSRFKNFLSLFLLVFVLALSSNSVFAQQSLYSTQQPDEIKSENAKQSLNQEIITLKNSQQNYAVGSVNHTDISRRLRVFNFAQVTLIGGDSISDTYDSAKKYLYFKIGYKKSELPSIKLIDTKLKELLNN